MGDSDKSLAKCIKRVQLAIKVSSNIESDQGYENVDNSYLLLYITFL